MIALVTLLRAVFYVLGLLVLQGAAALATLRWGISPWWSLLLAPLLLLAWGLWQLALRLWRRLRRRARRKAGAATLGQVPRNAALAQAWHRALQRSSTGPRTGGLPWFLMLGRPGAGKSTALARARIPSPLSPVRSGSDGGPGVAWWYTDRLVVMDCADALSGPDAAGEACAEWDYHLRMLRRHRRAQGIDGVVLALSARRLLDGDADELGNEARATRTRLEQLIAELGERFPVYVLITQCDCIYGFESWVSQLPEQRLQGALGYLGALDAPDQDFVRSAFDAIDERLQRMRWQMLADGVVGEPELLLFPQELQQLRAPLQGYADNCLAAHPYLERLLLRGIFFSSGKQQGGAVSRLLGGDAAPSAAHSEGHQGMFLRGLFAEVLPAELGLRRPSSAVLRRRVRRARALLGTWLVLAALGAFALSLSFVRNLRSLEALHAAQPSFDRPPAGREDQLRALLGQQAAIRRFELRSSGLLAQLTLPGTGWHDLLAGEKRRFVEACRARLGSAQWPPSRASGGDADPAADQAVGVLELLRLGSALQARAGGASWEQLHGLASSLPAQPQGSDNLRDALWKLQLAQIAWTGSSDAEQRARLLGVRARLDRLALQDPQLTWLTRIPALQGVAGLRAAGAWNSTAAADPPRQAGAEQPAVLAPEFTAAGYAAMSGLVRQWRALSAAPARVDSAWASFTDAWREQQEFAARAVLEQFLSAPPPLRGAAQWRAALDELAGADNPYWKFNDELLRQLAPPHGGSDAALPAAATQPAGGAHAQATVPPWLAAAREFALWRSAAGGESLGSGTFDALRSLGSRTLQRAASADAAGAARSVEGPIRGATELRDYLKALASLAQRLEQGNAQATAVAADFLSFGVDPKVSASLAVDADHALQRLRERLRTDGPGGAAAAGGERGDATGATSFPVDALLQAPWRALMHYANMTAACSLQQRWQSDVLWPLHTAASRDDMLRQVYGPQGTLWAFVDGPAAPFLRRDAERYQPASRAAQRLPFTPAFLGALNTAAQRRAEQARQQARAQRVQGALQAVEQQLDQARQALQAAQQAHAVVSLTALPTDVQPDGAPRVFSTQLTLRCASAVMHLDNLNMPQQRSVDWSPQNCSGVSLRIALAGLVLERQYPGPLGFVDWLADFRDGSHAFEPGDFPLQARALQRLGVRRIILRYRLDGADAALRAADAMRRNQQRVARLEATLRSLQGGAPADIGASAPAAATAPPAAAGIGASTLAALGLPARIATCWDDAP